MEIGRRRTETSYVTILSLSVSSSHYSSLCYSISVYMSLTCSLSTLPYVIDPRFLSTLPSYFCVVVRWVYLVKSNILINLNVRRLFIVQHCVFHSCPSTALFWRSSPLPLFSYSWNNVIELSWCNIMQTVRNPLEDSPTLEYSTESNMAGVSEVRLGSSPVVTLEALSYGIMLFFLLFFFKYGNVYGNVVLKA